MTKKLRFLTLLTLVGALLISGIVLADDGEMFRKNVSKTPDQETERGNLMGMTFYVPAQSAAGVLTDIEYYDALGTTVVETREFAKPLVAVYIDAMPEEDEEEEGIYSILSGAGFGAHDAYAALSLDDGTTWKNTNLSTSADLSSFNLANGHAYPGDAHNMTFAIAGDKVLVGWISKYCDGGSPAYTDTWVDDVTGDLLYPDLWGVAGSQNSVDYTLQGYPEVGEIPYSCVWSARGTLLKVDDNGVPTVDGGLYDIIWTKAERLTSGRRDSNRLEMNGDSAAGFMMTWQEDPEGLRPGQGLGPGEGWSGAVVNQQTDLWYSYISMDDFIMIDEDGDTTNGITSTSIYSYTFTTDTIPKVAVPMALPVRLTDNKMCQGTPLSDPPTGPSDPYCYEDFDGNGTADFCAEVVSWYTPGDPPKLLNLCKAEDGRVLGGRVGASRPRVNVQPYDSDNDGVYDSAWVIMGAEESKALGEGSTAEDADIADVGKNMWYYTFDMVNPETVMQGGMLNQPAIDPDTNLFFDPLLEDDFGNFFYETEISRRFSHFSQPIHQIGDSGVSAVLIVKQGILNQGGPADIFLRKLVDPVKHFVETTEIPEFEYWSDCEAPNLDESVIDVDGDENDLEKADLTGVVTDTISTGIGGVSVDLISAGQVITTAYSDADGFFTFQDVEPGDYTIEVTDVDGILVCLGYEPNTDNTVTSAIDDETVGVVQIPDFEYVTLCSAPNLDESVVDVDGVDGDDPALADLVGAVVTADGAGLGGVSVDLISAGQVITTAYSAADGFFTFQDVELGDYTIKITDEDGILSCNGYTLGVGNPSSVTVEIVGDYFPIADFEYELIGCVEPNPGESLIDINEIGGDDTDMADLTGVVTDTIGTGIGGVSVDLINADTVIATAYSDANGSYTFQDVTLGDYTIGITDEDDILSCNGYVPNTGNTETATIAVADQNIEIPDFEYVTACAAPILTESVVDVDGVVGDNPTITDIVGSVTTVDGAGIGGVSVDLISAGQVITTAYSAADGSFTFQDVGPGDYTVEVTDIHNILGCIDDGRYEPTPENLETAVVSFSGNPYAYENMACDEWAVWDDGVYPNGVNPRYVEGLCLSNMINVSGTSIVSCDGAAEDKTCAESFPWDGGTSPFPKVTEWRQCDTGAVLTTNGDVYNCEASNLDDQSWENPYDVAKGHRGFIDGDFIMMMYAWSPNWQANSVGNDHYNLYARRSFDGGVTWTTTPAELGGEGETGDGSDPTACENYKFKDTTGDTIIETVCTTYVAGEFEQARNLSQLIGNKVTILDPRYTPTGGIKMLPVTDKLDVGGGDLPYDDDAVRDPSKFFIVYETGDNTTVAEGEAIPMDLFYSRATNWGDDYDLRDYFKDTDNEPDTPDEVVQEFDWLEHDREDLSGEAANLANPSGNLYYAIWNQWNEDEHENVSNSDAIFRRIMYLEEGAFPVTTASPSAVILYTSASAASFDEEVTFVGSARDNDHMGALPHEAIVEYEWTSSVQGVLSTERSFSIQAGQEPGHLWGGWHHIGFRAKDDEGKWSPYATTTILVAEQIFTTYMPMILR